MGRDSSLSWLLNLLMSFSNHKGYLGIGESLIIKFVLTLTLSVNDAIVYMSLCMKNLKDNILIFSNRDWSGCLIVLLLQIFLWFGNMMILFEYVPITEH
jgi:hypothetical protein